MTALPTITSPVIINGYSEPGAQPNTNPINQADNAVLEVELLNGNVTNTTGLEINAGDSLVEGLAVGGFPSIGIEIGGSGGNVISGDFIGTNTTGLHDLTLKDGGLTIFNSEGLSVSGTANTIGGTVAAARNIISGNVFGVSLNGSDNLVEGNFVGTNITGATALPNQSIAIETQGSGGSDTIGGTVAAARN